jgi:hypothetical protein
VLCTALTRAHPLPIHPPTQPHTHTHPHIYIHTYIHTYICSGRFYFPQNVPGYRPAFQQLIKQCLVPEPAKRPFLPEIMAAARALL